MLSNDKQSVELSEMSATAGEFVLCITVHAFPGGVVGRLRCHAPPLLVDLNGNLGRTVPWLRVWLASLARIGSTGYIAGYIVHAVQSILGETFVVCGLA